MSQTDSDPNAIRIVRRPKVYLVGRQAVDEAEIKRFLADEAAPWSTDAPHDAERLCEAAGRICYMSFGKGRRGNAEYLANIIGAAHGSVLEHAVWNFVFTGISRSLTHELIRHRAGFSYSQLSQRYVDESTADFVEPDCIAGDAQLHALWLETVATAQTAYRQLVAGLAAKFTDVADATLRRKLARQAARSVLPNACETKIFVSANARSLRHFIELRGSEHADVEIRELALQVLRLMRQEAPNLFGDFTIRQLPDGTEVAATPNHKV